MSDATDGTSSPLRLAGSLKGKIWALAAATPPGGTIILAGDSQGKVTWWNATTGELLVEAKAADPDVVRTAIPLTLPDGRVRFATASGRGTVQLWDVASEVPVGGPIVSESGIVWSMASCGPRPGVRAVHRAGRRPDSLLGR